LSIYRGDILVILEADTLPMAKNTIDELIKPLKISHNIGMVVGSATALKPSSFFEKILYSNYQIKSEIFGKWRNGVNIYTFNGYSMKAVPRKVTDIFSWAPDLPEDAFIYLWLKKNGFAIFKQKNAKSYMRNVANLSDRISQCSKFVSGKKSLAKYFGNKVINDEYNLPVFLLAKELKNHFLKNPLSTSIFLSEIALNRLLTLKSRKFNPLYKTYQSSKILTSKVFNYRLETNLNG
jgi:hypothetical protein